MTASSVSMSSTVCEFPVGIINRVTVSIEDYKTLKGKIIHYFFIVQYQTR